MKVVRFKQNGFTLVELIVVIVITGILSTFLVQFILLPIQSYSDVARRTRLVDIANSVIEKIRLDVREALPNSLRVGDCDGDGNLGDCLEFLRAPLGGRYRAFALGAEDELDFAAADNSFHILTPLTGLERSIVIRDTDNVRACSNDDLHVYVAVNNTGNEAWSLANMARVTSLCIGSGSPVDNVKSCNDTSEKGRPTVNFADPFSEDSDIDFLFPAPSIYQRFYLVDRPIKYIWEGKKITRYSCYKIDQASVNSVPFDNINAILANNIEAISFSYQAGTDDLPVGLLTVSVTVKESGGTESITLLQQIQILNMS
jgi:MSHA biogenesis protein MshO